MQIKSYVGTSAQEILAQIKAEMGPDAIILSNRDFRKDGQRWHEVTAGVDRPAGPFDGVPATSRTAMNGYARTAANLVENTRNAQAAAQGGNGSAPYPQAGGRPLFGAGGTSPAGGTAFANGVISGSYNSGGVAPNEWAEWQKDWRQIREHIYALMQPSIQWDRLSPRQRVALEYMRREGVEGWVLIELYQRLAASPGASVLEALAHIAPTRPWGAEEWPERVHILTGPAGSGKTTTALRMAALLRQERSQLKIACINVDCERGNGRLLLRHMAELSDFMYFEATDAASMQAALRGAAEADAVFIDLPALGGDKTLSELLAHLDIMNLGAVVHLTLPPHYGNVQTQAFLDRYQTNLDGSIVWTKLDEAAGAGPLVNLSAVCGLPVSALSYGSGLRASLSPALEPLVWRLVFKRQLPGQNAETN